VFGNIKKSGFSLLELLLVMAIVAVLALLLFSNAQFQRPGTDRDKFFLGLNAIMQVAWQQTVMTNELHRIFFDLKKRTARVERVKKEPSASAEKSFGPLKGMYAASSFSWPAILEIKEFVIEGQDKMKIAGAAGKTVEVYFYIIPGIVAQPVTINVRERRGENSRNMGLVLNVFNGQFKRYDTFQK
jgi:prepilin-type N-terminal cleavage/methylation domain-containing protein